MHVETIRSTFKQQLEAEEWNDELVERLHSLFDEYKAEQRRDVVYRALYEKMREGYKIDCHRARERAEERVRGLPKAELFVRARIFVRKPYLQAQWTKQLLIEEIVRQEIEKIESDSDRVRRVWAGLSEAQKQGLEPL